MPGGGARAPTVQGPRASRPEWQLPANRDRPARPSSNGGYRQQQPVGSANLTDRTQSEAVIHRRRIWPEGIHRRRSSVMAATDRGCVKTRHSEVAGTLSAADFAGSLFGTPIRAQKPFGVPWSSW